MRIDYTVHTKVDKNIFSKVVSTEDIAPALHSGLQNVSVLVGREINAEVINIIKQEVVAYQQEFNKVVMDMGRKNSMARQLAKSLRPTSRGAAMYLDNARMRNQISVQDLMTTMYIGHELLLKIRQVFTGQQIQTKFLIKFDGKLYEIDEENVPLNLILSQYGGTDQSNPMNLAYSLDKTLVEELIKTQQAKELQSNLDWGNQIWALKPEYLKNKSAETGRKYTPFWNSKDAEIYYLLTLQEEQGRTEKLALEEYANYRAQMGGGGGYRSTFFKVGDVGKYQIKSFNFDTKGGKSRETNFIRFSLLRDRFNDLANIFNTLSGRDLGLALQKFFTETDKNLEKSDEITQKFNEEAKEAFSKIF